MTPMLKKSLQPVLAILLAAVPAGQAADKLSPAEFVDDASAKASPRSKRQTGPGQEQVQDIKTFAQSMIDDHTKANEQSRAWPRRRS